MIEKYWIFKVFVLGNNNYTEWEQSLPARGRAKIGLFIRRLANIKLWPPKLVFPIAVRGHSKIRELRIKGDKVQYRPLGCFGPNRGEFILLYGAYEKDDVFIPKDAPERADDRRILMEAGKGYLKDYDDL